MGGSLLIVVEEEYCKQTVCLQYSSSNADSDISKTILHTPSHGLSEVVVIQ